jgi:hypothetical protein
MKLFFILNFTILSAYFGFSQCKSITSYKYKNADEVFISTPLFRASKGISDHVSHSFGNANNDYFVNTSVELNPIKDVLKWDKMVYVYTLGNGSIVEKTIQKKHIPILNLASNSLTDATQVLEGAAIIGSLLGGGSYAGSPQQKVKYIFNKILFSHEEFEAIYLHGISGFKIKFGENLSKENVYKYNNDFYDSSKKYAGCVYEIYKNKNEIKESNFYKPTFPKMKDITNPEAVKEEINKIVQQKLKEKYVLNQDFSFLGIINKEGKMTKVKIESSIIDKKMIGSLENLIENLDYGLTPAYDSGNKPIKRDFSSKYGF